MRTILLTIVATLSVAMGFAQDSTEIAVKEYTLELKSDGSVSVDIDIDFTQLDIKTTQLVVLTPVIINGQNSLKLKSIAVYGRNRRIY